MSAIFVASNVRPPRREWSSRTADLDTCTSDLRSGETSDLQSAITQDVERSGRADAAEAHALQSEPNWSALAVPPRGQVAITRDLLNEHTPNTAVAAETAAGIRDSREPTESRIGERARAWAPGTVVDDRYLIEQVIGCGGTAVVFRARDLRATDSSGPNSRLAIKAPRPDVPDRGRAASRLQHEFRNAQPFKHSNVVEVFDLRCAEETWFMTMELIEGKSLAGLLREWPTLTVEMKRTILKSCAAALSYAHSRDVIHGDFKPANVLVSPDGQAKIFDFGASSLLTGEDTRIPAGTPAYASPQVLEGVRPERRDDVFSFACVAYELLTGQHPFERRSSLDAKAEGKVPPRAWNLSASEWLALLSALSWEREQRPTDIASLLNTLTPDEPPIVAAEQEKPPAANNPAIELPEELIPPQRGWGFFVFAAIALAGLIIAAQRQSTISDTEARQTQTAVDDSAATNAASASTQTVPAGLAPGHAIELPAATASVIPTANAASESETVLLPAPAEMQKAAPKLSSISFDSQAIITTESSIAAVFIVTRSEPLANRISVRWHAESGSARSGEDFIDDAKGTIDFADGQSQRAIYIPLRNDVLEEEDETFTVTLSSAQRARLGEISEIEATIRDDD